MKKIWMNRNFILSIAAIILAFVYISKLKSENERMRAVLPHMLVGDNINYFDLISTDALKKDFFAWHLFPVFTPFPFSCRYLDYGVLGEDLGSFLKLNNY